MPSTNTNNFRGLGFWGIRFRAGFVLLVILVVHSIAADAQQSLRQLLRDGGQLLRAGNYAGALEKFKAATEIRQDAARNAADNRVKDWYSDSGSRIRE